MTLDEGIAAMQALRTDDEAGKLILTTVHPDSGWEGEVEEISVQEPSIDGYARTMALYREHRILVR